MRFAQGSSTGCVEGTTTATSTKVPTELAPATVKPEEEAAAGAARALGLRPAGSWASKTDEGGASEVSGNDRSGGGLANGLLFSRDADLARGGAAEGEGSASRRGGGSGGGGAGGEADDEETTCSA